MHPRVAELLGNLGRLHANQSQFAEAERLFQRSLALSEKSFGPDHHLVASTLIPLAAAYHAQGRTAEAKTLVNRSINIGERSEASPGERYLSYLLRSRIAWELNERTSALSDLRHAMDLAEDQRGRASGAEQERAQFFSNLQSAFGQMIAWQHELGDAADLNEVVAAIERSRARSLLDDLSLAGVDLGLGRPAAERERLRQQEIELKSRAAQLEKQWTAVPTNEDRARLLPQLAEARQAVCQQYREQRTSSPLYRDLLSAGAAPLKLPEL